jgi:hypothetical protein
VGKIFISYRREDSSAAADRLSDRLLWDGIAKMPPGAIEVKSIQILFGSWNPFFCPILTVGDNQRPKSIKPIRA